MEGQLALSRRLVVIITGLVMTSAQPPQPVSLAWTCANGDSNRAELDCFSGLIHVIGAYYGRDTSTCRDVWCKGSIYICVDNCRKPMQVVDYSHYEDILQDCDGHDSCRVSLRKPDNICSNNEDTQYVLVEYRCYQQPDSSDDLKVVRCNDQHFDVQLCRQNTVIHLTEGQYKRAYVGEQTCPVINDDHCSADVDHTYEASIKRKCEGRQACDDLLAQEVDWWDVDWDDPCYNIALLDSEYVELSYKCYTTNYVYVYKAACIGAYFSEDLCSDGFVIRIIHAFYGDIGIFQECNPGNISIYDYLINVKDKNTTYYNEIVEKCEGKPACEGLVAQTFDFSDDDTIYLGRWNTLTEYVLLAYDCIYIPATTGSTSTSTKMEPTDSTVLPSTQTRDSTVLPSTQVTSDSTVLLYTRATSESTTRQTSSFLTTETNQETSSSQATDVKVSSLSIGIIAGVPAAAVVVVVVIVVAVICAKRRRKDDTSEYLFM